MNELIKIFKALSDQNRLRIVKMLEEKPMCVCEITEVLQLANSTVSKHLSILRNAGLIVSEKEGRWINYRLNPDPSLYLKSLKPLIKDWINDDPIISKDKENAQTSNREEICST
ncbi:MAG TPA: metalloregulator ArsR/SmtB family transcription factor [bacterium]|nr:metalloregulator ArsR/SmtB family transcription factor [bacterium]